MPAWASWRARSVASVMAWASSALAPYSWLIIQAYRSGRIMKIVGRP